MNCLRTMFVVLYMCDAASTSLSKLRPRTSHGPIFMTISDAEHSTGGEGGEGIYH
jgi:hypothetical protein